MPWLDTEISAIIINKKPKAVVAIETAIKKVNNLTDQISINLLGFTSTPSGAIEFAPNGPQLVFWDPDFPHDDLVQILSDFQDIEHEIAVIITSKKKDTHRANQIFELGTRMGIGSMRWVEKPYNTSKLVKALYQTLTTTLKGQRRPQEKVRSNKRLSRIIRKQNKFLFFVKNQPKILRNRFQDIDEVIKKEFITQIQLKDIISIVPHPKSKNYLNITYYNVSEEIEYSSMLRGTISAVEKILNPEYGFIRVSRSCIINTLKIIAYNSEVEVVTVPGSTNNGVSTHKVTRIRPLTSLENHLQTTWSKKGRL